MEALIKTIDVIILLSLMLFVGCMITLTIIVSADVCVGQIALLSFIAVMITIVIITEAKDLKRKK